jgi:hypothetical protein
MAIAWFNACNASGYWKRISVYCPFIRPILGIPAFCVGEEMYFGKDRLEQVEEALRS